MKKPVYPLSQVMNSSDEVDLVDHASNLASGNTDKYALVQPVEIWCRRLDLRCSTKHVLTRADLLAATEAGKNLRAAVAHSLRTDIQQVTAISLKCEADVSERRAVRQNDLPIGAGSGEERAVEFRPGECATSQGDDSPSPLRHVPEIEGPAQTRLQSEDLRKARFGESLTLHALTPDWCRSASGCSALQPNHLAIARTSSGRSDAEREA